MSTTMTAKEIAEAWLGFVTETFMIDGDSGRPDATEELKRMEESGRLQDVREERRAETDTLIGEILDIPPESRRSKFSATDPASLALVYDRVNSATRVLTGMVQQGTTIKTGEKPVLEAFFRQMLLQKM